MDGWKTTPVWRRAWNSSVSSELWLVVSGYADTDSKSSPEGAFNNLAWGGNPRMQEAKPPPRFSALVCG